jgi:hypothetical protein
LIFADRHHQRRKVREVQGEVEDVFDAVNAGPAVNTPVNETRGSFSRDGLTLYFGRAPGPEGGSDIFVAKYSANGELVWARRMGGPGLSAVCASRCDVPYGSWSGQF